MKRVITGVILLFTVLAFTICGAADLKKPKKLKKQKFKIEFVDEDSGQKVDKKIEFNVEGYDDHGNPIITESDGTTPWGVLVYDLPEGAEEVMSIHYVNPCCVIVNRVKRCKPGC